jgi:copper chaperone
MTQIKLAVPDISCDHCKMSIEGAVGELAGVSQVEVSVVDRTVDVDFAEPLTRADIVSAIEEQGYEVA